MLECLLSFFIPFIVDTWPFAFALCAQSWVCPRGELRCDWILLVCVLPHFVVVFLSVRWGRFLCEVNACAIGELQHRTTDLQSLPDVNQRVGRIAFAGCGFVGSAVRGLEQVFRNAN